MLSWLITQVRWTSALHFEGGAGIAIAFALASFIGFEATAIYGEESKDPKRAVPRATYWAIGLITVLFTIVSFAMVTGLGAADVVGHGVVSGFQLVCWFARIPKR